jgi:integrase/recombinase XerD
LDLANGEAPSANAEA